MKKPYTDKQGQYLAFIYYYTKLNGRAPAEADIERYFRVTPPSVHQMVLTLETRGSDRKNSRYGTVDPAAHPTRRTAGSGVSSLNYGRLRNLFRRMPRLAVSL